MKLKDTSKHLQWIHDRMVNIHGENENYDYMIKLRAIIEDIDNLENNLNQMQQAFKELNDSK